MTGNEITHWRPTRFPQNNYCCWPCVSLSLSLVCVCTERTLFAHLLTTYHGLRRAALLNSDSFHTNANRVGGGLNDFTFCLESGWNERPLLLCVHPNNNLCRWGCYLEQRQSLIENFHFINIAEFCSTLYTIHCVCECLKFHFPEKRLWTGTALLVIVILIQKRKPNNYIY